MIPSVVMHGAESSGVAVTSSLGTMKEIANWVITFTMENPVLMIFFCSGLIYVGIRLVRAIIHAIKK